MIEQPLQLEELNKVVNSKETANKSSKDKWRFFSTCNRIRLVTYIRCGGENVWTKCGLCVFYEHESGGNYSCIKCKKCPLESCKHGTLVGEASVAYTEWRHVEIRDEDNDSKVKAFNKFQQLCKQVLEMLEEKL